MKIKVLLVDDHQLMRDGLRAVLLRDPDIEVVAEAVNGRDALDQLREIQTNIIIMDIAMAGLNGIDATRRIHSRYPKVKVIGLSTYNDKRFVIAMLEAGAVGYVIKAGASEDLIRAIHTVYKGEKYISPEITRYLVESYLTRSTSTTTDYPTLGAREREVLQMIAEGKTSAEMAKKLFISISTVEAHRRNLMKKLDIHSIAELTKYAIREGITSLEN